MARGNGEPVSQDRHVTAGFPHSTWPPQSALLFATLLGRLRLDAPIKAAPDPDDAETAELARILAIK